MNQNELYHFGVLGMRWGIRRYQNKDGTLTSLGKKHASGKSEGGIFAGRKKKYDAKHMTTAQLKRAIAKEKKEKEKAEERKALEEEYLGTSKKKKAVDKKTEKSEETSKPSTKKSSNKKDVKSMSTEELIAAKNRLDAESNYLSALDRRYPQKVSFGQKLAASLKDKAISAISESVHDAGKAYLTKKLKEMSGVQKSDKVKQQQKQEQQKAQQKQQQKAQQKQQQKAQQKQQNKAQQETYKRNSEQTYQRNNTQTTSLPALPGPIGTKKKRWTDYYSGGNGWFY